MIVVDDRNGFSPRPNAVRLFQVASTAGSRNPGAAASAQYPPAARTAPTAFALPSGWHAKSPKHFRGTARRDISFATMTEHSAARSKLACERWESGTGL